MSTVSWQKQKQNQADPRAHDAIPSDEGSSYSDQMHNQISNDRCVLMQGHDLKKTQK